MVGTISANCRTFDAIVAMLLNVSVNKLEQCTNDWFVDVQADL